MLLTLYGWQFRKTFDILGHSLIKNVLARRSESPVPSLPLLTKIELLLMYAADPLAPDAQGCTSLAVICENIHTVSLRSVLTGAPCRRERCA